VDKLDHNTHCLFLPGKTQTTEHGTVVGPVQSLMSVNGGVKSWKRRRSCRGMLYDDDDDDDDDGKTVQIIVKTRKEKNIFALADWCGPRSSGSGT